MNPIIHIGIHKTASSWFQKELFPNVPGTWLVSRRQVRQWFLEPRAGRFDPAATRQAIIDQAGGRRPILSEENLSGYPQNGGLGGLVPAMAAERLAATLPDACVLILLRNQPSAIAATYRQYVRSGGTYCARDYLHASSRDEGARRHWYKVPLFDPDHFDYDGLVEVFAGRFGRDRVHPFLFEAFEADPTKALAEIAGALHAEFPAADTGRIVNRSAPSQWLPALRFLNRFTRLSVLDKNHWLHLPGWYGRRLRLIKWLAPDGERIPAKPAGILGADSVQAIERRFAASNRRLADRWQLPLQEYGYQLSGPLGC